MSEDVTQPGRFWRGARWAFAGLGILLLLWLILVATNLADFLGFYSKFSSSIGQTTGMNRYLVRIVAAALAVPAFLGVNRLLSLRKQSRRQGALLLGGVFVAYNLLMFALTGEAMFHHGSGRSLKWYAVTPEGVRYFDSPGVDPKYGVALREVTPDILPALRDWKPGASRPLDADADPVFDAVTGASKTWWRATHDGGFRFFSGPGFDPADGAPLQPVTADVVARHGEWRRAEAEKRAQAERARQESAAAEAQRRQVAEWDAAIAQGDGSRWAVVALSDGSLQSLAPKLAAALSGKTGMAFGCPVAAAPSPGSLLAALASPPSSPALETRLFKGYLGVLTIRGRIATGDAALSAVKGLKTWRFDGVVAAYAPSGARLFEQAVAEAAPGYGEDQAFSEIADRIARRTADEFSR